MTGRVTGAEGHVQSTDVSGQLVVGLEEQIQVTDVDGHVYSDRC